MLGDTFHIEHIDLRQAKNCTEIKAFLARFDLSFSGDVDFTVAARLQDGTLVGTGSYAGEVLRNIAIDEHYQGEGLTATILSALMQEMARNGILHYFIFTRPAKAQLFANLGFNEIARAEPYAALLESGLGSINSYAAKIANECAHLAPQRAAIVINGNPFTLGHQALIQKAANENAAVIVFVVEENRSLIPFADRFALIKKGVAAMPNVAVVAGGHYIVSAATFPTYFTREEELVPAQTRLDVALFATQIAPRLGIVARYIGEEPYCQVTAAYNAAMFDLLPPAGIAVRLMPRILVNGQIVSASKVRELIRSGDWHTLSTLVPETTLHYLQNAEAIIEKIRGSQSRH